MRKPLSEPIWTRCYCAAIATAVAGVAAAGVSAYGASQQGKATSNAQGAINSNPAGAYGTRMEEVPYHNTVKLPKYDPSVGAQDYSNSLPLLSVIGRSATKESARLRDSISGGQASANLKQAGVDIGRELRGEVPTDVVDRTNRIVAERTGGGAFSPGGTTQSQTDFARSIGTTSSALVEAGLSHAPQWEAMVGAFTYTPQQAGQDALGWLRSRNDYALQKAGLQFQIDQQTYTADLNNAKIRAGGDPQVQGQIADNLKLDTLKAGQDQRQMDALLGLVKTGAGAVGSIASSGSSGGLNDAGFYTSASAAATAGQGAPIASYYSPGSTTPQYYIAG